MMLSLIEKITPSAFHNLMNTVDHSFHKCDVNSSNVSNPTRGVLELQEEKGRASVPEFRVYEKNHRQQKSPYET